MKKIVLDVEALNVTTFETQSATHGPRGTVEAHATTLCNTTRCDTALYRTAGCATCGAGSCADTCGSGVPGCVGC